MKSEERLSDVKVVMDSMNAVCEAFTEYTKTYNQYRNALKTNQPVTELVKLNGQYKTMRYKSRTSYNAMIAMLTAMSQKYKGDAMGEVFGNIKGHIDAWRPDRLKTKYAAKWLEAFVGKLDKLLAFKKNLNGSKPRQNQIKRIAAEAFDSSLPPVFDADKPTG